MKINAHLEQGWKVHYIAVEPFPYKHKNLIPHILTTPFKNHDTLFFLSISLLWLPGLLPG